MMIQKSGLSAASRPPTSPRPARTRSTIALSSVSGSEKNCGACGTRAPPRTPCMARLPPAGVGLRRAAAYSSAGRPRGASSGGAAQRQRLVRQHGLGDDAAGFLDIELVARDEIAAIRDDRVGVLHQLQALVNVVLVQPHALADDLENVEDTERPFALMRAKLAMVRVIDRN